MIGQKQHLTSELIDDRPVVFLLAEENNPFIDNLILFFKHCALDARLLLLESFTDPGEALKQYKTIKNTEVYKFLVVGGFKKTYVENPDFLLQVLRAFERSFAEDGRLITIFFLLNYSTPISPMDFELNNFKNFWSKQNSFLNQALKAFPLSQFCLVEDILNLDFDFNLKFNLFFSPFKKQFLLDSQNNCYWQTQDGFLRSFKTLFFQSKPSEKHLLRGQKTHSTKFLLKAKDLCSRYFLQKFDILELFLQAREENYFLADFIRVYSSDEKVFEVLDEKIRQLPLSLNKEMLLDKNKLQVIEAQKIAKESLAKSTTTNDGEKLENDAEKAPELNKKSAATSVPEKNTGELLQKTKKLMVKNEEKIDKSNNIDKTLQDIFREEQKSRHNQRFEKNLKGAKKIVKKSRYRRLSFYFGIFLSLIGALVLVLFANFYFTQKLFEKDLLAVIQANLTDKNNFQGKRDYHFFKWQLDNYGELIGEEIFSTPNNYWQIFEHLKKQVVLTQELNDEAFKLYQAILKTDGDVSVDWANYLTKNQEFYQFKQELNSLLDQLNPEILPKAQAEILAQYKTKILKELASQQRSTMFLESLSRFLLSPARSNLVVLIQDSNELRSSGGFLVSVVNLSFENSHLLNWRVYDVSDLDQRIYGEREAPEELRNMLAASRLLLRDANWPASFADASSDITWFIEQSLNMRPNLILTLNSKEIYGFLEVLSPLMVNEFELNQNNFFEELLRQENVDFNSVLNSFFERLSKLSKEEVIFILTKLNLALDKREAFLYSDSQELSEILKNNLWSGEILETPCPSEFAGVGEQCFTDGIYQLENNVGLNKVNRLITQEINHSIGISEKFIRHKRVIRLENLGRQNFWPEGNYQAYLKLYLPKNANLERITFNEKVVNQSVYKWFEERNKRVLAHRFTVPILSSVTLELIYLIPHQLEAPFSYVFLDQKQAGLFNKQTHYKVLFAEDFSPSLIAPQANYQDKVIEFSNDNQDNFLFAVGF